VPIWIERDRVCSVLVSERKLLVHHVVYLALGANIGDAKRNIEEGFAILAGTEGVEILVKSRLYRNAAVGGPDGQA
jgi:7,8-dihydro-6-hydroxymethylpterin-pyrophosphokinase